MKPPPTGIILQGQLSELGFTCDTPANGANPGKIVDAKQETHARTPPTGLIPEPDGRQARQGSEAPANGDNPGSPCSIRFTYL